MDYLKNSGYKIEYTPILESMGILFSTPHANELHIIIPKNIELAEPIRIMQNSQTTPAITNNPRKLLIIAQENSKASIIEILKSKSDERIQEAIDIEAKEGSNILFMTIQDSNHGNENNKTHENNFNSFNNFLIHQTKHGMVGKDATLVWLDCSTGNENARYDILTELVGKGAKTDALGMFYGKEREQFQIFIKNNHIIGGTTSDMLTKVVLDGKARSEYLGTVRIEEGSSGSNGYQKQDVLLLSPTAVANAKPNLEINNNEVRCTHGVSIGQLDLEKMFYLMSRGLSNDEAKAGMVRGFFETVLRRINNSAIKQEAAQLISRSMVADEQ